MRNRIQYPWHLADGPRCPSVGSPSVIDGKGVRRRDQLVPQSCFPSLLLTRHLPTVLKKRPPGKQRRPQDYPLGDASREEGNGASLHGPLLGKLTVDLDQWFGCEKERRPCERPESRPISIDSLNSRAVRNLDCICRRSAFAAMSQIWLNPLHNPATATKPDCCGASYVNSTNRWRTQVKDSSRQTGTLRRLRATLKLFRLAAKQRHADEAQMSSPHIRHFGLRPRRHSVADTSIH